MLADGGRAFGHGRRSISAPARRLAGVSRTLVGTASWTDPTLVRDGHFYPPEAKSAEARLRFYADQFPIVEVDSTYYFPPSEKNAVRWIDRTPKDFTFNIKAYFLPTFRRLRQDPERVGARTRSGSLAGVVGG
jgi:uncharacterized protein YecE (DUF72 family)